jgi:hypothetical protein
LACATKKTRKKISPIEILLPPLQITNWQFYDYQTKSHLIRAITRPRPTTACSGQLAVRQKAVMKRVKAGSCTGIYLVIIIGNASLYFNGRYFFSWFFVARANQKIRILALGRGSSIY